MQIAVATLVAFLFSGLINTVTAQQQLFKNYTVNDGLVSSTIRKIYQDSKGFIWIGTLEGLSKYDGYKFTNYTTANGLSHNLVNDFYEAKGGRLYVALNDGSIDLIKDDKIIPVDAQPKIVINQFLHTAGNHVIAVTDNNGLVNFRDGKLNKLNEGISANTYYEIINLYDSIYITASNNYIEIFNRNYSIIKKIKVAESPFSSIKIFRDSKSRIWIASNPGIKCMRWIPGQNKMETIVAIPDQFEILNQNGININDIFEDADGIFWFATSIGIVKINPDKTYQVFTIKEGLSSNNVTSIFQDKETNIWFGTVMGISKLVTRSGITLYPLENGIYAEDNQYLMYPIMKNKLLARTSKTITIFNKQSGTYHPVQMDEDEKYYGVVSKTDPPLFIGSTGLSTFDTINFRFIQKIKLKDFQPGKIISDKRGNFFLGTLVQLVFSSTNSSIEILQDRISALLLGKDDNLWAGTWEHGLFRIQYNLRNNHFQLLKTDHF